MSMAREVATASQPERELQLSIVIPIYNEQESLSPLLERLLRAVKKSGLRYEIIAVDDGSLDGGLGILREHAARIAELKIVRLLRHSGQTAAIMAGFDYARGEVIVTMDAD